MTRVRAFRARTLLATVALTLFAPPAAANSALALWLAGEYDAAYELAVNVDSWESQLLAARAATDFVIYGPGGHGTPVEDERLWLTRAMSAAERAMALNPAAAQAVMALARAKGEVARRSGVLQNLGAAGELKRLFDLALRLDPQDADALVGLAMWHLELVENGVGWLYGGKREEVLPLIERGVASAPEQVNLRVEYATALAALGHTQAALEQLTVAVTLPANSATDAAEQVRAERLAATLERLLQRSDHHPKADGRNEIVKGVTGL